MGLTIYFVRNLFGVLYEYKLSRGKPLANIMIPSSKKKLYYRLLEADFESLLAPQWK